MAHLLVVEDDPVSSRILTSILQKRGHEPHLAASVSEAITVLERNTLIDMVILDNQLQGEYGWQFLEYVRKDFIFRSLPVLVYTGSSDRNSVLKYLQLGVQKILVKPYNALQIEDELKRAIQFDWRGMAFEPSARVCQRLNITEDDYYKSLIRGASDVRDHVPPLNKLVGSKDLRMFDEHLSALQSIALNLGVSLLENAVESIQQTVRDGKLDQCIYLINRLIPTARLMHHRALSHFGITKGVNGEFPQNLFDDKRGETLRKAQNVLDATPTDSSAAPSQDDPLDTIIQSSLGAFVDDFKIFTTRELMARGEAEGMIFGPHAAVGVDDILASMRTLRNLNVADMESIVTFIRQFSGLESRIIEIGNLCGKGEHITTLDQSVQTLGVNMVGCLAVPLARLRASRRGRNPLRLEAMARHNMATALLVRELAIKFSGTQDFALAALAYDVGSWLLAIQYPAFFGMTLLLHREGKTSRQKVERNIFGTDHYELSAHVLSKLSFPQSVVATSVFIDNPEKAPTGDAQIVAAMVNLADLMAKVKKIGYGGGVANEEDFIKSPAWGALKKSQVEIPLDPPEYLSALSPVVDRVRSMVDVAFE
jgi:CheY-like chemotaxis protein/HD-like signal output (HDOD) protein